MVSYLNKHQVDVARLVYMALYPVVLVCIAIGYRNSIYHLGEVAYRYVFIVFAILISRMAVRLHIIIHELGHCIFGLAARYTFADMNILGVLFYKKKGRMRVGKYNREGYVGYCGLIPPENTTKLQHSLFIAGGGFLNMLLALLFFILSTYAVSDSYLYLGTIVMGSLGIWAAAYNLIPLKFDSQPNDGYYLKKLYQNQLDIKLSNHLHMISMAQRDGMKTKDMPSEWFDIDTNNANYDDPYACTAVYYAALYQGEMGNDDKAFEIFERLLEYGKDITHTQIMDIQSIKLYYELLNQCRKDVVTGYYTDELKDYIDNSSEPYTRRLGYAYYLLFEKNIEEAQKRLVSYEQGISSYPYSINSDEEHEAMTAIRAKAELDISEGMLCCDPG